MRIGVTGGRTYRNREVVRAALIDFDPGDVLIHGNAPGADTTFADVWVLDLGRRLIEPHAADWRAPCRVECKTDHRLPLRDGGGTYCPAAGVYRNQEMVDSGLDLLIAAPGGRGTADMMRRAERAGIPINKIGE